jgi:hypothetical protein
MNRRTICSWMFAGLLAAGCGGRMSPVTFAPDNMELAKSLSGAVGRKDLKTVQSVAAAADRRDPSKMPSDEKEAIKWVLASCEKGEWDKAKEYIDKCISSGK